MTESGRDALSTLAELKKLNLPNAVNRRRAHGSVAHELALLIIGGRLRPGDVLPNEDTLSAAMSVSRTAYREGMRTLAAKGLVNARQKVGTSVNPREAWNILDGDVLAWYFEVAPDPAFIRALFELRRIVEPAGAELAAVRHKDADRLAMQRALDAMHAAQDSVIDSLEADLAFHRAIAAAAQNEALLALSPVIEATLRWSVRLKLSAKPRIYETSLSKHGAVLAAVLERDGARAHAELAALIDRALLETLEALDNQSRPA